MDPLTAFGLASNVVSFLSFASDVIKASSEIYLSGSGSTSSVVSLDYVYTSLSGLSTKLQSTYEYRFADESTPLGPGDAIKEAAVTIRQLAGECKKDCDKLLSITETLRLKDSSSFRGKWESFRVALRKVCEQKKIEEIENRLSKTQTVLTLHICVISAYGIRCLFCAFAFLSFARRLPRYSVAFGKLLTASDRHYLKGLYEINENLQAFSKKLRMDQKATLQEFKSILSSVEDVIHDSARTQGTKPFETGDFENLHNQFKQLSIAETIISNQQRVLSTLRFEERPLRHNAISEAHKNTLRWLLEDDASRSYSPVAAGRNDAVGDRTLARWLESQNGIFWISGKPGSGKSTLMKFIAGEARTHKILSRWASPVPVVIASHYFWSSESRMQRSQEGLLRTLLYEILRQHPELTSVICEEGWHQLRGSDGDSELWSFSSLNEALRKISEGNSEIKYHFCFFIDGLDEFDGNHDDHFELCQTMGKLSESPHIKICLSSRPWNVFKEAFATKPSIQVQDLTWNDIRNYTSSRLEEHPRWLEITTSFKGQWLIDEIANRSSGVFLWVYLVTMLLREGMTNRDRLPDLRRRLDTFPVELDDFFTQILHSVEPIYYTKTASMLQIALSAKEPLEMFIYDFHDLEHEDEDYHSHIPRLEFAPGEVDAVYDRMTYHLNSRTRGLLELASPFAPVTFLHRTVRDYLTTKAPSDFIKCNLPKSSGLKFIPELSILRAYAAWIKRVTPHVFTRGSWGNYHQGRTGHTHEHTNGLPKIIKGLMPYAGQLDAQPHLDEILAKVLDDIDATVAMMLSSAKSGNGVTNNWAWNTTSKLFLREQLADGSVANYVAVKEAKDPSFGSDDWSQKRLSECMQAAKSRPRNGESRLFNGSGTVVSPLPTTMWRQPTRRREITPEDRVRAADKTEWGTAVERQTKRQRR